MTELYVHVNLRLTNENASAKSLPVKAFRGKPKRIGKFT